MKVKLQAGAEIDFLTKAEMDQSLTSIFAAWQKEIGRGIKWRKFSFSGTVTGATWAAGQGLGNNDKDALGPQPGMVWAITRIAVSGGAVVEGTDIFDIFVDEPSPTRLVASGSTRQHNFDVGVFVLTGGETLYIAGAATGVGVPDVFVSGQAVEVPAQLAWQLL